jgi:hypothetical protein
VAASPDRAKHFSHVSQVLYDVWNYHIIECLLGVEHLSVCDEESEMGKLRRRDGYHSRGDIYTDPAGGF